MKSLPTSSGWMALATRTFLSQSSTKIYVSFHTHGPCFWLNCAKSPVFDRVLAASLTLATTSWAVALYCPTATLDRTTMSRATARATRILPLFIRVLPQPKFLFDFENGKHCTPKSPAPTLLIEVRSFRLIAWFQGHCEVWNARKWKDGT